jgi:ATP-dependent Clp protease protease subunit
MKELVFSQICGLDRSFVFHMAPCCFFAYPPCSTVPGTRKECKCSQKRSIVSIPSKIHRFGESRSYSRKQSKHDMVGNLRMGGGVPKVPYKAPGQQNYEFIDIFNRFYRERIIYIGQEIDEDQANQIIAILLFLQSEDDQAEVQLYINCPGGFVLPGLAVYDCMCSVRYPIVTVNLGMAASMGAFLAAAGTPGRRFALPNSRYLIQQPLAPDNIKGQAKDIEIEAIHILKQREILFESYAKFSKQPVERIRNDLRRDLYLTAYEAREYGLVDKVLTPRPKGLVTKTTGVGEPIL